MAELVADYRLAELTAGESLAALRDVLGPAAADASWKHACAEAGCPHGPLLADDLMKVLTELAKKPGIGQVVARSCIIRLHTSQVLQRASTRQPARSVRR